MKTEIIKLTDKNKEKVLAETEGILRTGKIAVVPTDTVYGIVGNATRSEVIRNIFALKNRPQEKAFPIFVKSVAEARKFAYISDAKAKFLGQIWPGPITVVFEHKDLPAGRQEKLPTLLTGGLKTLGLRIPNHPFLLELLSRLNFPLAQTSANISNKPPAKNSEEIKSYFESSDLQPDLVVNEGEIAGKASTVVDFTGNSPIVLRTGLVSKEELEKLFQELEP